MEKDAELIKLGKHIRKVRKAKGMTQKQLAHALGKDQQSIQRLEAGNINATVYYLSEIAKGLGINLAMLFEGYE